MPVELRARRARPSYKAMFELPDDEGGSALQEDDASSESAFELAYPEDNEAKGGDEDIILQDDEDEGSIHDDESDIAPTAAGSSKSKTKGKATTRSRPSMSSLHRSASAMLAPGLSRPSARQNYALPLPSLNHRHRGVPIYLPPLRTLRLINKPSLFAHVETVLTRSISDTSVGERVTRAIGNNFGQGPVWELIEDRSWFKEYTSGDQTRRIVYDTLKVDQGWQLLSPEQASLYTPNVSGGLSSSPRITCFFGPYDKQSKVQLDALQAHKMSNFFPDSKSHVFYAGAPVWAIDWCPVSVDDLPRRNYRQYLAVAPFPCSSHSPEIGRRAIRPFHASIQIWSLSPTQGLAYNRSEKTEEPEDPGAMKCELVLCMDDGPAHDMKWCPLPAHDMHAGSSFLSSPRKLGLLGGTFEDGSLSFYVVPDPETLTPVNSATPAPLFVKLAPSLKVELDDASCWSMDWANSDLVAVGCTNGSVAIFRVRDALENPSHHPLRPTHYFRLHQSAIRSLSWVRAPPMSASGDLKPDHDPTVLVSGGYDGAQMITDIRDLRGNVMNRTRDAINSIVFSHHVGGPVVSDHENTIKNFGITPSMLGRGHALLEPSGPVWSIAASDFHPHIAVGSADGTCQTTNMMKSTRRSGAVPFFIHKIFQMDYSRASGKFRMLENFLPFEHQDKPAASRASKKKKEMPDDQISLPTSTGAWSPEVSVTRVTWQSGSGLARSPLLASSTASGLCRVDWLLGRFANNRFPYRDIETLRGDVEGADGEEDVENE